VHSADGWRALEPVIGRYRDRVKRHFRGDAAFANPRCTSSSKPSAPATRSACRPTASCRQDRIPLKRPSGDHCTVRRYFASFTYQTQSWQESRRVVAKVEWHPNEL
jgi:hypothetical protein